MALNEIGIHNVVSLFLVLGSTADIASIGQRLQNILLQARLEKLTHPRQTCLTKGHMAMLVLFTEQEQPVHGYIGRFLEQLNAIAADENKLSIMRIIVDGVEQLFARTDAAQFGEHLLLGEFLPGESASKLKLFFYDRFMAQ